jgi:hypothetical protein
MERSKARGVGSAVSEEADCADIAAGDTDDGVGVSFGPSLNSPRDGSFDVSPVEYSVGSDSERSGLDPVTVGVGNEYLVPAESPWNGSARATIGAEISRCSLRAV